MFFHENINHSLQLFIEYIKYLFQIKNLYGGWLIVVNALNITFFNNTNVSIIANAN